MGAFFFEIFQILRCIYEFDSTIRMQIPNLGLI